jgi:hypothetical protein
LQASIAGQLSVVARTRPLQTTCLSLTVPYGQTIAEIEAGIPFESHLRPILQAQVNGVLIPRKAWSQVRPKPGVLVNIVPVPEGGGSEWLRLGLTLAVVALAVGATGGVGGLLLAGGASPLLAGVGASVVGATISIAGMMAINALIPPAVPQMDSGPAQRSPHYSLEGARNEIRLHAAVMQVLGRHRVYPPHAAPPYTSIDGDDQYLHLLLDLGYGPLDVTERKIGETDLFDYSDVDDHFSSGIPGQLQTVPEYDDDVVEDNFGRELRRDDGWVTFTTRPDSDRASIDIHFRQGLIRYDEDGDVHDQTISFELQYSPAGQDDWQDQETRTYTGKTGNPIRRTANLEFPTRGQYDIQIQRLDADSDSDRMFRASWIEVIRSIRDETPVQNRYTNLWGIKLRASRQLSGTIDTVNCVITSRCLDKIPGSNTWTVGPTRNPASLFRHVLQNDANENKVPDDQIDLVALADWWELCNAKGWTCDFVVDRDIAVEELLNIIAGCGRASKTEVDGKYSVCVDAEKETDEFHLTPRNCRNLRWRRIFAKTPQALRIRFPDETSGYKERTRDVFDDGFNANNTTRYEDWEMPGVTNPDLIHKHGRKRLAEIQLRPETYEAELDYEWLTFTRGSKGRLTYDTMLVGTGWGRIKSLATSGSNITTITLDESVVLDSPVQQLLRVRRANGTSWSTLVGGFIGESPTLTLITPQPSSGGPAVGDIAIIGTPGRETMEVLCTGIRPGPDLSATATFVPYAEAVHSAENGPIPDWNPLITDPPELVVPEIERVTSDEQVLLRDHAGNYRPGMVVTVRRRGQSRKAQISGLQIAIREVDTGAAEHSHDYPAELNEARIDNVRFRQAYEVRARYRLGVDKQRGTPLYGVWSTVVTHMVGGPTLAPANIATAVVAGDRVIWVMANRPPDLAGYRVRYTSVVGQSWEQAQLLTDGLITVDYVLLTDLPDGTKELLVKAETTAKIESQSAFRINVSGIPIPRGHRAHVTDLGLQDFPGTLTDAERVGGALQAVDKNLWLRPGNEGWLTPGSQTWLASSFATFTWEFSYAVPAIARTNDRLVLEMVTRGDIWVEHRWSSDSLIEVDPDEPLPAGNTLLPPGWVPLLRRVGGVSGGRFVRWRNGVRPIPGDVMQFQVFGRGGTSIRPVVEEFRIILEAPEIEERLPAVEIEAGGSKVAVAGSYRGIVTAMALLRHPTAATNIKRHPELEDLTGPFLEALDRDENSVHATADVIVSGY